MKFITTLVLASMAMLTACEEKSLPSFSSGSKKPSGLFVWETEILGAQIVTKEDFRSDGSVYHSARGVSSSTTETRGTWTMDGDEIQTSMSKDGSTYTQTFRWDGTDLLRVREGKNGKEQAVADPPRYRKQ